MTEFAILRFNRSMEMIMGAGLYMIRDGLNFPLGGSRLVMARKL